MSPTASAETVSIVAVAVEAPSGARWTGLQTRLSLPGIAIDLTTKLASDDGVPTKEMRYVEPEEAEHPVATVPAV